MAWDNQGPWGKPSGGGMGGGPRRPTGGGGGGKPQGPDLDELLRKSREQWKTMFPQDGNGGAKGLVLLLIIVVLLWLSSGVYFVKADEQGVVLRFGEYHRTTGSGLNYHMPYPFESALMPKVTAVNRVEVGYRSGSARANRENTAVPEESLMVTGDENIVDINFEVQWKIREAPDFLFNIRNPEDTVKAVSESAMREVIGQSKIATVLTAGREDVAIETKLLIQSTLDEYKAGIEIIAVNLRDVNPPDQVIAAFRDVQSARLDMETSRNQAEAYRNDILPKARGAAQQMILEAEAYKQEVIARAQGEASRFAAVYEEYRLARDVTKQRIYLETMEDILSGMNKVIIDEKGSGGVVPYLPLDSLKARQPATQEAKP
ncbi:MAG: FtsH protease activity modulator HflK [Rickettsiales bacterium]|jgi:membrane protease subunit HflK|nr:FtsH protease activity modulator HflK [Rickettsiales bacterium]